MPLAISPLKIGLVLSLVCAHATAQTTQLASQSSGAAPGNGPSEAPVISADGRLALFQSNVANLATGDVGGDNDIFVRDRIASTTTRVSVSSGGGQSNGFSTGTAISADGRFVAMTSNANNLVPGDVGFFDVFLHDRWSGQTTRVGLASNGAAPNAESQGGAISADARFVAFFSDASNLVPSIPGGVFQVYVRDRGPASPFSAVCTGDLGAACPCGNNSVSGANEGCLNSFGLGGKLVASGAASPANDTLVLSGSQMTNGASQFPSSGNPTVSAQGLVTAPGALTYQAWYRNAASFCTPSTFNLTNGLWVVWTN